ncbi:aspartic peptidase domain-containing protein [Mycena alexandri]|uniref:Aspartic peptidase domain-containing protein n=1 Tax=Mycena alexandri TaxID=1745969 RepID=A0AAD6SMD9_9AGAR|nr:aspartic peptidase domain-containing protein [Mycena alexandri]
MVRIAISTAFVAAVIGLASAMSLEQRAPIKASVKKISTVTNSTNVVAHDRARLNHYFKKNPVAELATTGSASVTNEIFSYIAETKVGSQTFDLIVDTGSSNTWVGATTKFTAGSTGKSTGDAVSVSYGSGSFSGTEYTDTVSIGGTAATKQSIGVAKSSTGFTGTDGIVGFGPEELTEDTVTGATEVPTFLQTLVSEGVITDNILGVSFAPLTGSSESSANGELTFGGVDDSAYTGDITYTTRVAPYWGVSVSKFAFGSTSLGTTTASGIVDTGTTLFYVPTAVYNKFLTASKGKIDSTSGLVKFTTKPTKNFTFVIGGTTFTLTPAQYLIAKAQYSNWGISSSSGYYTFIGDGGSDSPNTILGQSFLEFYYSVYDTKNNRVGLATAA